MWRFSVSVFGWLRKNNTAIAGIMLSLICIGLVIAKLIVLKEIDFVSLSLLLLAAISFRPTMIGAIPRFIRRFRVAGWDVDFQDPKSDPIQATLADVAQALASSPVPDAPTFAATTTGEISDIVRTRQLVLHDGNCERARLFVGQDGAVGLELCDSSGERRAGLWVATEGVGAIALADDDGLWRLRLNGTKVPLIICDSDDVARTALIVDDDVATLAAMDRDGEICSVLAATEDGGRIQVNSPDRKSSAGLTALKGEPGSLYLADESGSVATSMSAGSTAHVDKSTDSG